MGARKKRSAAVIVILCSTFIQLQSSLSFLSICIFLKNEHHSKQQDEIIWLSWLSQSSVPSNVKRVLGAQGNLRGIFF